MQNDYEELIDLYEELEHCRQQRGQMAMVAAYLVIGSLVSFIALRIVRIAGVVYIAVFLLLVIVSALIGLLLLSNYIRNEVETREIEAQIELIRERDPSLARKRPKRKKKRKKSRRNAKDESDEETHFNADDLGDDGELSGYADEDEEHQDTLKR